MIDTFRKDAGRTFGAILKPLGFKKHGLAWQRTSGKFIDLVDIQASQFDRVFTINLGVALPSVRDRVFNTGVKISSAASGTIETRLGFLAFNGHDYWWSKDKPLEVQDAVEKLQMHSSTFFEKFHDTSEMIRTLESEKHDIRLTFPKSFYLALLHVQFGDKQKGCKILHEIAMKPPAPWNEPALGLLHKYACSS